MFGAPKAHQAPKEVEGKAGDQGASTGAEGRSRRPVSEINGVSWGLRQTIFL